MNTNPKGTFGTPENVFAVCNNMQLMEDRRALDRSKINRLFNGLEPYTKEEEERHHIQLNVNWGLGPNIIREANGQINSALLHPGILFQASYEAGPSEKRDEISQVVTAALHAKIQRGPSGKAHAWVKKSQHATLALHGIGPIWWPLQGRWLGRFLPLEDLLIPTDTFCDFSNLGYFAINIYLTVGEFAAMTKGDKVDPRWNQKMVNSLINEYKDKWIDSASNYDYHRPEQVAELLKQNRGYFNSDVIPKIRLRAFFWKDVNGKNEWFRHIVLRDRNMAQRQLGADEFIYDGGDRPFATDLGQIMHVTYGDDNKVAPLKYHSVRGLGVPLYAPVEAMNRLQCQFFQSAFEHLKMLFRYRDPADRDRAKSIFLQNYGFVPEGLEFVKQQERHQIDPNFIMAAMGQLQAIMSDTSSSFQPNQTGLGGKKELKEIEAQAIINKANRMVSAALQGIYTQEQFYYEELVRRFFDQKADDQDIKDFQQQCQNEGVDKECLHIQKWRIVPEQVLGGGDKTLAQQRAVWLWENKSQYEPDSQRHIMRTVTSTILDDPAKGDLYVPKTPPQATEGTYAAENLFGTLMQGVPCSVREGIDHIGYVEAMLKMMLAVVQRIQQTDNTGTLDEVIGLQNVATNIGQHLIIIAGDEAEKQRVKQYGEILGQVMNEIKGFASRIMEAKMAQGQMGDNGEGAQGAAKAQTMIMLAQTKAKIAESNAQLKAMHKDMQFKMDEARKNMQTVAEIKRQDAKGHAEMFNKSMQDAAQTMRDLRKPQVVKENT